MRAQSIEFLLCQRGRPEFDLQPHVEMPNVVAQIHNYVVRERWRGTGDSLGLTGKPTCPTW